MAISIISIELAQRLAMAGRECFTNARNIGGPDNNGLHQTGREGAAASRPVVEARPAGEAGC
jgi:hypothetical protein